MESAEKVYRKVEAFVKETGMLDDTDLVIAGVSGGADSVFLFHLLLRMRREMGFALQVVHVHHGIRGAEADRDAEFVRNLCGTYHIPCRVIRRDIPSEAAARGMTLEEAGRAARYEEFAHCREEMISVGRARSGAAGDGSEIRNAAVRKQNRRGVRKAQENAVQRQPALQKMPEVKIALAHHKNDVAETMLFNLSRGAGVEGLAAIRPVRGAYVRPLLAVDRNEIIAALRARNISWCEDSTNALDDAVRNRIRHSIIPAIENEVNPAAVSHMASAAACCADAADFLRAEAEKRAEKYLLRDTGAQKRTSGTPADAAGKTAGLPGEAGKAARDAAASSACGRREGVFVSDSLLGEMKIMRGEILRMAMREVSGSGRDFQRVHVEALEALLQKSAGAHLDLPQGLAADKAGGGIRICKKTDLETNGITADGGEEHCLHAAAGDRAAETRFGGFSFFTRIISRQNEGIPEKTYTKWFDYDKISSVPAIVRHRRPGDFLTVNASGGRKSLSDYLTNEKIPREARDRLVLLADGNEIIWAVGMRIGYRYRVTDETRHILEVKAVRTCL